MDAACGSHVCDDNKFVVFYEGVLGAKKAAR